MKRTAFRSQLLRLIVQYRLDFRSDRYRYLRRRLERGRVSDTKAKIEIRRARALIEAEEVTGRLGLMRPPTVEELYPDRPPDITVGHAIEAPDLPIGFTLSGTGNSHALIAGNSGAGKTSFMRLMITKVHELNATAQALETEADQPDRL